MLTRMCNASIAEACLPSPQKEAVVIPEERKQWSVWGGPTQGSVLGPLLYVGRLYTADLIPLIQSCAWSAGALICRRHEVIIYGFCNPQESISLSRRVMVTVGSTETWMTSNRLRLNQQKTDFLWCGTRYKLAARDLDQLAAISSALILHFSVRDLGVILDSELSFEQHASKVTETCFFPLMSA